VVPFTWTIYFKEKQYHVSIWKNVEPLTIYFQLIIIFFVCLIHIVMRFFFQLFSLSTKCQEQSNILEKHNGKRVCVKDEWKCLLLLYIIISLFCLSKCNANVVTKLIFENPCHTLVRWWCKGIYKILTIGKKNKKQKPSSLAKSYDTLYSSSLLASLDRFSRSHSDGLYVMQLVVAATNQNALYKKHMFCRKNVNKIEMRVHIK
jgi:hypothetical protein